MPSLRHLLPAAAALCLTLLAPVARGAGASATCADATAEADAAPVLCPGEAPPIRAAQALEARMDSGEVTVSFGNFSIAESNVFEFWNGVQVQQEGRALSADEVTIDKDARSIEVRGSVAYREAALVVEGDAGRFQDGGAEFEGVQFQLPERPARGAARAMSVDRDGVLKLQDVQYTTCPPGHDDWTIGASSVSINTAKSTAVARDARLEFFGVPLLRLPVISFPVGNARKSGVLFPNIGSSTSGGVELAVPYYFNIAPQQDFTATPTWYSNRGIDFGGEYRYLARFGHGTVQGNLLPGDNRDGGTRSRLKVNSISELAGGWRLTIDAENVSDTRYLEDFARGTSDASTPFLPRTALLAWRDDHLDLGVQWRNFQTLYADLPQVDRPHTELPRLFANGDWELTGALPLNYGAQVEAVNFRHDGDVQGWRLHAAPQLALDYAGTGWFLRPAATLQATHYRLRDADPGIDTSPTRTLPVLSLDTGLVFEGSSGRRNQRRVTLEPRMMYLYAPYRDQDDLPVFDTAEPDLNWVELFRDNRYVGIDRISDANQVSAGITARLFSSRTGQRYVSATLGQVYYIEKPRVLLPDEPEDPGRTSDLIAEVELSSFRNWNVNTGWQWDPQGKQTERAEVRLQYRPESRSVLNFGYRYQRDRMEQLEFSAAWPLSDSWRLYGRSLYSLRDNQVIENFAGFEYGSCCWAVRAVARDYVGRRSGERDRSLYLQLELKGLSNVGLAADAFLERAIRGYSTRRRR
jgi:LPS-assembly protein